MRIIFLTGKNGLGRFTKVDDDKFYELNKHRWGVVRSKGECYVARKIRINGKHTTVYMHRWLMGNPKGKMVDHKNGDTIDNQVLNLRISTNSQNQMNRGSSEGSRSKYKGVLWNSQRGKYKTQIRVDGEDFFFGYSEEERNAALIHDLNVEALHGGGAVRLPPTRFTTLSIRYKRTE
jgi:hypothetical protein